MESQLDQLKKMTTIVADTGDIEAIRQLKPVDATTNPSLLLKASQDPAYHPYLEQAKAWALTQGGSSSEQLTNMTDKLAVLAGCEILSLIPGRISTEVDARLSFDTSASVEKAKKLIGLYNEAGISNDRVLIKIASTWEGIEAARQLEKEGINCNLTLLFGFSQAIACADAGAFLISPFVGRILDWYKASSPEGTDFSGAKDPGVQSVSKIFNYYKTHSYDTVVMGASFRNSEEIRQLAGCDRLTISPALITELAETNLPLDQKLFSDNPVCSDSKLENSETLFRWSMNEDAMATEKLAEGIRNFAIDQAKLEQILSRL
ncbi:transaldolase [Amphritea balenae]|uniref:Transaldolase n=1 Tax=Amphritea balenae TaxID=452629 RepID=A0A3P1SWJ2_9GAMM|nr:transaldolase [Amphritea balenae]RRD01345.1 transaldolase [Amphritea balenae]GGK57915.1 transaldolase [Amphritea balenae]